MSQSDFVHFRLDPELVAQLDRFVEKQRKAGIKRFSRAKAARMLIQLALKNDPQSAVLDTMLEELQRVARSAIAIAGEDLVKKLPALVKAELG